MYLSSTANPQELTTLSHQTTGCYSVFHEPQGNSIADFALLICYPYGQEYIRSHRALRSLAIQLAKAGVPCLRFDYRGTGDSTGEKFSLADGIADIQHQYQWLTNETGLPVKVLGVRVGALLALKALKNEPDLQSFSLWDPVISGAEYLKELQSAETSAVIQEDTVTWVNGYPMGQELLHELETCTISADTLRGHSIATVGASNTPKYQQWIQDLNDNNVRVSQSLVVEPVEAVAWGSINVGGGFVNPQKIIAKLSSILMNTGVAA